MTILNYNPEKNIQSSWNAVYAVALGVSGLIISEFLPVSLLTPMAKDLSVTEGVAGQAISVTAIVAMVTSLVIAIITRQLNRRWILLIFCLMQILSNLLVAFAPDFGILLVGRVLLGIGIGGFWTMAAATAMRLVQKEKVPKALSVIFGAVSIATVVAAPVGSYLGAHIGWRNVFLLSAVIGGIALIWQAFTLPSMPVDKPVKFSTLIKVLKRPNVMAGMLAALMLYIGYSTFFTYLRPFLETVTGVDTNLLSAVLLGFGIANLIGSISARYLLAWDLYKSLGFAPLLMGIVVALLVLFGGYNVVAASLIALWGLLFGVLQVGWVAWLTRTIPDEAESGGGIQVATIQLAISLGAVIGGLFFDYTGARGVFICSSLFTLIASLVAIIAFKIQAKHGIEIEKIISR
ncbi:Predicted arabinose efflux permease, MFS family [Pedobacter westerhofensis]|uniref:Predicted arabinose efflux permease, MFS family n=1 Tax=Pedobacter westerhofensis TaxID=425512 RepID=A0A521AAJ0_9SPHI|nr:MFS transporter [Pedobacter westerhofensis]SMO31823.1 Predicted arabinose efflux permease, MFS family [Pedobacter westerhofensis]